MEVSPVSGSSVMRASSVDRSDRVPHRLARRNTHPATGLNPRNPADTLGAKAPASVDVGHPAHAHHRSASHVVPVKHSGPCNHTIRRRPASGLARRAATGVTSQCHRSGHGQAENRQCSQPSVHSNSPCFQTFRKTTRQNGLHCQARTSRPEPTILRILTIPSTWEYPSRQARLKSPPGPPATGKKRRPARWATRNRPRN